jgi:hypothetical protein
MRRGRSHRLSPGETIDVPGASSTRVFGINDHGQISGVFTDSTGDNGFLATRG